MSYGINISTSIDTAARFSRSFLILLQFLIQNIRFWVFELGGRGINDFLPRTLHSMQASIFIYCRRGGIHLIVSFY